MSETPCDKSRVTSISSLGIIALQKGTNIHSDQGPSFYKANHAYPGKSQREPLGVSLCLIRAKLRRQTKKGTEVVSLLWHGAACTLLTQKIQLVGTWL